MELFRSAASKSTPEILFDPISGVLRMAGESYPENSFEFYAPVISWLARFLAVHNGPVTLDINFSYLNTGSTKCMMDILDILEENHVSGRSVQILWHCDAENDRAIETAEEFREEVTLPFHIVTAESTA